jgi:hypothetical protein
VVVADATFTRPKDFFYPADWIAGVEYDDTENNDKDYNQSELEELEKTSMKKTTTELTKWN